MSRNIDEVFDSHDVFCRHTASDDCSHEMTEEDDRAYKDSVKQAILADLLSVMPKKIEHQSYCDLLRTEFYINIEDINCSCSAQDINDTIDQVTAAIKNYIKGE